MKNLIFVFLAFLTLNTFAAESELIVPKKLQEKAIGPLYVAKDIYNWQTYYVHLAVGHNEVEIYEIFQKDDLNNCKGEIIKNKCIITSTSSTFYISHKVDSSKDFAKKLKRTESWERFKDHNEELHRNIAAYTVAVPLSIFFVGCDEWDCLTRAIIFSPVIVPVYAAYTAFHYLVTTPIQTLFHFTGLGKDKTERQLRKIIKSEGKTYYDNIFDQKLKGQGFQLSPLLSDFINYNYDHLD